ncbi:MAG: GntR family transcriptional regulator [Anaerolineales bacterium]|nr:GntR family transcriptional regulator [Anaerolineales bacterium]
MRNDRTLLQRIYTNLNEIIQGAENGTQLPSEPKLASELGVSRTILREALTLHEIHGSIVRRHGAGTFVVHTRPRIDSGLEVFDTVEALAMKSGLEMRCAMLKIIPRAAKKEESVILKLMPEARVLQITRVMEVDQRPVAFMMDVVPEDLVDTEQLDRNFDGSILKYFLAKEKGFVATSHSEIKPEQAGPQLAELLKVRDEEVILSFNSKVYNRNGEIVYIYRDFFLPEHFNFHVLRRVEPFP